MAMKDVFNYDFGATIGEEEMGGNEATWAKPDKIIRETLSKLPHPNEAWVIELDGEDEAASLAELGEDEDTMETLANNDDIDKYGDYQVSVAVDDRTSVVRVTVENFNQADVTRYIIPADTAHLLVDDMVDGKPAPHPTFRMEDNMLGLDDEELRGLDEEIGQRIIASAANERAKQADATKDPYTKAVQDYMQGSTTFALGYDDIESMAEMAFDTVCKRNGGAADMQKCTGECMDKIPGAMFYDDDLYESLQSCCLSWSNLKDLREWMKKGSLDPDHPDKYQKTEQLYRKYLNDHISRKSLNGDYAGLPLDTMREVSTNFIEKQLHDRAFKDYDDYKDTCRVLDDLPFNDEATNLYGNKDYFASREITQQYADAFKEKDWLSCYMNASDEEKISLTYTTEKTSPYDRIGVVILNPVKAPADGKWPNTKDMELLTFRGEKGMRITDDWQYGDAAMGAHLYGCDLETIQDDKLRKGIKQSFLYHSKDILEGMSERLEALAENQLTKETLFRTTFDIAMAVDFMQEKKSEKFIKEALTTLSPYATKKDYTTSVLKAAKKKYQKAWGR